MPTSTATLLTPERRYECPKCGLQQVRRTALKPGESETPMHTCRALAGAYAPIPAAGIKCDVQVIAREDYVGGELVRVDGNGRPFMAVRTVRDDGFDTHVMAPAARTVVDSDELEWLREEMEG